MSKDCKDTLQTLKTVTKRECVSVLLFARVCACFLNLLSDNESNIFCVV